MFIEDRFIIITVRVFFILTHDHSKFKEDAYEYHRVTAQDNQRQHALQKQHKISSWWIRFVGSSSQRTHDGL